MEPYAREEYMDSIQGDNVPFLEIWVRLAKFNNLVIETEGKKI